MKFILVTGLAVMIIIASRFENVQAQTKISGMILDSSDKPIGFANVILLNPSDSAMVKGTLSTEQGRYTFENIKSGKYLITATYLGSKQFYTAVFNISDKQDHLELVPIKLDEADVKLNEVVISAKKPLYEQKVDRMVINVKSSIVSVGGSALDVLERSPGIRVNRQNNSLSMSGKEGVVVMINGKVNHMPLSAVVQMLAGMNANNIEKIELISTPPSKYDAEGNAGFINIVLVSNPGAGTNGSYSLSMGYGDEETSATSLNFNHRKSKINLYGDYSFLRDHQKQKITSYRQFYTDKKYYENQSISERDPVQRNHNARLGIDYQVGKSTVLGALVSGYDNKWSMDAVNTVFMKTNKSLDTSLNIANDEINHWRNFGVNGNLQHTFKNNKILSFNLDYLYYHDSNPTNYLNSYYNGSGTFLHDNKTKSGKITPLSMWVGNTDFSRKLGKKIDLETGIKAGIFRFSNNVRVEHFLNNNWVSDNSLSANYTLKEEIAAAYTSFKMTLNSKTEVKAGLRYEYTSSNLGTEITKNIIDRNYGNLFPTLYFSRKLSETQSLNFSYSKRITRPTFNDMAPFVIFIDPNTFFSGNSAIQPSISNSLNTSYLLKKFIFSLGYSHDDSPIAGFQSRIDSVTRKEIIAAENMKNMKTLSTTLSLPFDVFKWWNMQNNITGRWQQINATYNDAPVQISQKDVQIVSTQNFKFSNDLSVEVVAFYQTASLFGKSILKPFGIVNLGIQKKTSSQKSTWSFNISDLLNTGTFSAYSYIPDQNLNTTFKMRFQSRTAKITYSRTFGNDKLTGKRERKTASEEERRRVN